MIDATVALTGRRYGSIVLTGDREDLRRLDPGMEVVGVRISGAAHRAPQLAYADLWIRTLEAAEPHNILPDRTLPPGPRRAAISVSAARRKDTIPQRHELRKCPLRLEDRSLHPIRLPNPLQPVSSTDTS